MNEQQLRQLLNQGTPVRPAVADALRRTREEALARQRPAAVPALAWAGNVVGGWGGFALRVLMALTVLVIAGAMLYSWQQNQRAAEVEEIDSLLLTDDLPIDAYLDRGFQNWLKKRMAEE